MKKLVGTALVGTALLFSSNSAEASTPINQMQVQKVQEIQFSNFVDKGTLEKYCNFLMERVNFDYNFESTPAQSETQPAQEEKKPVSEPEIQQAPEDEVTPSKPESQPVAPKKEENTASAKPEVNSTPTQPAENAEKASVSEIEQAVLNLTNAERQKAGLAALQTDSNLMESAREKSKDMATRNYFSHTSPTYGSPFDQMKKFGVTYKSAGENIAMGQRNAEAVVKAWMESPGHRENIMKPNFTHIGIGYDPNGNYWTQQFIQK